MEKSMIASLFEDEPAAAKRRAGNLVDGGRVGPAKSFG
jgi:hypothetical protein